MKTKTQELFGQGKIWSHTVFNTPTIVQLEELIKTETPHAYLITLTPELASHIKATLMFPNRKYVTKRASRIAHDITTGRWHWEGSFLKFVFFNDPETDALIHRCADGQHRLGAIIMAGKPVEIGLLSGLSEVSFNLMDGNRVLRTNAQRLHREGYKNSNVLAATAKLIAIQQAYGIDALRILRNSAIKPLPTGTEELEIAHKYNEEIQPAIRCALVIQNRGLSPASSTAYSFWRMRQIDPQQANWFFEVLIGKEKASPATAPLMLYEALMRVKHTLAKTQGSLRAFHCIALYAKAWNNFMEGIEGRRIQYRPGGAKPEPMPDFSPNLYA